MKKMILALWMVGCLFSTASAEAVTLKTVSIFAGMDAAADTYVSLLLSWEKKTGNIVLDSSATSDEAWKQSVLNDFGAGNEADVLFYFTCTAESAAILDKVVPIAEINAMYPDLNLIDDAACAERNGLVYAIPIRPYWEALFCNIDLFAQYGLELPTTWDKLLTAIQVFKENGVVPIAASLSDVPHYLIEMAILASGTPQEHMARPNSMEELPQSWVDGLNLILELYQLGAFPEDANMTIEAVTSQMFRDKKAAMQVDGSWFANGIPAESMDSTIVIPFPARSGRSGAGAYIGGYSMGFYLSRKAWNDESKRDAAVDLLAFLTTGENAEALSGYSYTGELLRSVNRMQSAPQNTKNPPIQDVMDREARKVLFNALPALTEGEVSAEEIWAEVMALTPFKH